MIKDFFNFLFGLAGLVLIALAATLPATWMLMLFMGNVGLAQSYWGALPLGILVSGLIGAAGNSETNVFVRNVSAAPVVEATATDKHGKADKG
jgi:hypothetical protein